jgi:hypothetical protein
VSAGSNPAGGTKFEHWVEGATAILADPDSAQEQRSLRPFAQLSVNDTAACWSIRAVHNDSAPWADVGLARFEQAGRDVGTRQDGGLTSAERQKLAALRRENRRLREDVGILKRATAFFASM